AVMDKIRARDIPYMIAFFISDPPMPSLRRLFYSLSTVRPVGGGISPGPPLGVPAEINKSGTGFPTPHEVRHKAHYNHLVKKTQNGYNEKRRSEMLLCGRLALLHRTVGCWRTLRSASIYLDGTILLHNLKDCKVI